MDPSSPFGTLSSLPVELRLQIWHQLLSKPVKVLTPQWFLRARDALYHREPSARSSADVAVFLSSKACGLEAMEVFYAKNTFSFCALPSGQEFEFKDFHDDPSAAHFISQYEAWTPSYPSELAARHIKHLKVSLGIPYCHDRSEWGYQMSDRSLCMDLMRQMQTPGGARKTCSIDLLFFCKYKPPGSAPVLGASLFQGLKTLTAFEKFTINCSGYQRLVAYALHPNKPRPHNLDYPANMSLRCYFMLRIAEELEPTLGPAIFAKENHTHIVEFHPRTHGAGLKNPRGALAG